MKVKVMLELEFPTERETLVMALDEFVQSREGKVDDDGEPKDESRVAFARRMSEDLTAAGGRL